MQRFEFRFNSRNALLIQDNLQNGMRMRPTTGGDDMMIQTVNIQRLVFLQRNSQDVIIMPRIIDHKENFLIMDILWSSLQVNAQVESFLEKGLWCLDASILELGQSSWPVMELIHYKVFGLKDRIVAERRTGSRDTNLVIAMNSIRESFMVDVGSRIKLILKPNNKSLIIDDLVRKYNPS